MKKHKTYFVVLALFFLAILSSVAHCSSHWDTFLQQPDKNALAQLEYIISANKQRCNPDVAPEQKHRTQLYKLIQSGNEQALRAALMMYRCWDGGELEDFFRSAGEFFEIHPNLFLQILHEKIVPESHWKRFFVMLPLDTVDKIDLQLATVEKRIYILNGISEEPLYEIKVTGIFYLEKKRRLILRVKKELDKAK